MALPRQRTRAAFYLAVLASLNFYICRDLFSVPTAHMNSMHGFWIALAGYTASSWWSPVWWPYWDNGIPFEFTYAPLVPALIHAWSVIAHVPKEISLQTITALVYMLLPIALFTGAWLLTRAPELCFAAAMLYSLTSPAQLLVPDQGFRWSALWDSRRLLMTTAWDETPHLLALSCLPLTIFFLARSIETGSRRFFAAAALSIALASYASAFAPVMIAIASICLIASLRVKNYKRNAARVIAIGLFGYAAASAFLPPSLIRAIHADSSDDWHGDGGWNAGSLIALAIVVFGLTILCVCLPRWTPDWRVRFFALFTFLTGSIPVIAHYLHRQFLPQPVRYEFEMEMGLALLVVFGIRSWFAKMPIALRRAAIFLLLALAFEQAVHFRHNEKLYVSRVDLAKTVESRASVWAVRHLPGVRVMFPGSIAQWANAFGDVMQFSGSSWSLAYNRVQQRAWQAMYFGDARVSLAWLRAFGVGAVGVSAPNSEEFWKGFAYPGKFDGVLRPLWQEGGVTIYEIPRRSGSLAHVIHESALVSQAPAAIDDIASLEKYGAALEDPSLPEALLEWDGPNRIRVHTTALAGQAVSIQVSYHPGWRAIANGRKIPIFADGLGLMWLRPECDGPCEIQLNYNGGFELRFFRVLSTVAIFVLAVMLVWPERAAS